MSFVKTIAADGHELDLYIATPEDSSGPFKPLILVQEIFGLNKHIRSVGDRFAAKGFTVIAPALFDRISGGIELGYEVADRDQGIAYKNKVSDEEALLDITAAKTYSVEHLGSESPAIVGYCWGGTLAWLAAARESYSACVPYYGGQISTNLDRIPGCPVLLHFGELDKGIGPEAVSAITEATKSLSHIIVHTYAGADHGFNCDARATYNKESAGIALERTLTLLN